MCHKVESGPEQCPLTLLSPEPKNICNQSLENSTMVVVSHSPHLTLLSYTVGSTQPPFPHLSGDDREEAGRDTRLIDSGLAADGQCVSDAAGASPML